MFNSPISRGGRRRASTITKYMGDPSSSSDGDIWYNTLTGQIRVNINGVITTMNPSSNSGIALLEQHTASASATLDFTNFISSTYDEYVFEFVNIIPATDATALWMRMSTDGGATYDAGASAYKYRYWRIAGGTAVVSSNGDSKIILADPGIDATDTNHGLIGHIRLFSPGSSSLRKMLTGQIFFFQDGAGTPPFETDLPMGSYENATAVNAVRFLMSSGNIASGIIRVYGLVKS